MASQNTFATLPSSCYCEAAVLRSKEPTLTFFYDFLHFPGVKSPPEHPMVTPVNWCRYPHTRYIRLPVRNTRSKVQSSWSDFYRLIGGRVVRGCSIEYGQEFWAQRLPTPPTSSSSHSHFQQGYPPASLLICRRSSESWTFSLLGLPESGGQRILFFSLIKATNA